MYLKQQNYWLNAVIKNPGVAKWYSHWRSSLDGKRSPLGDELPWITYGAINWLNNHLTKDMLLFEWGSGGSTAFFSQRVKQVVTVEHDPVWYQDVSDFLKKKEYKNVSLTLVEPVQGQNIDPWYKSTDEKLSGHSFEQYIKQIDIYPDNYFDVIIVDGRARPGCMKQALTKVKPGCYLILDNSDRTEYDNGQALVSKWKAMPKFGPGPYVNFPTCTTIWQRPVQSTIA